MRLMAQLQGLDSVSLGVKYLIDGARLGLKFGTSEAAGLFVGEAKELVPVDTGRLRDAIHQEQVTDEPERQIHEVKPFVDATNEYGIDPPYARRIEYGFIGQDRLGRNYHQPAQPYMRPAYDNKKSEAEETIKSSIYDQLDVAMNRAAAGGFRRAA